MYADSDITASTLLVNAKRDWERGVFRIYIYVLCTVVTSSEITQVSSIHCLCCTRPCVTITNLFASCLAQQWETQAECMRSAENQRIKAENQRGWGGKYWVLMKTWKNKRRKTCLPKMHLSGQLDVHSKARFQNRTIEAYPRKCGKTETQDEHIQFSHFFIT